MNKMRHLHCPFCLAKSKGEKVEEGHYYWKCWNGHEFTTRVPSRGVRGGGDWKRR